MKIAHGAGKSWRLALRGQGVYFYFQGLWCDVDGLGSYSAEEVVKKEAVKTGRSASAFPLHQQWNLERWLHLKGARRQGLSLGPESSNIVYFIVHDFARSLELLKWLEAKSGRGHVHQGDIVSDVQTVRIDRKHDIEELLVVDVRLARA